MVKQHEKPLSREEIINTMVKVAKRQVLYHELRREVEALQAARKKAL